MPSSALTLRPDRERSLVRQHPWIFSGAVARVTGDPGPGDTVVVTSSAGESLGLAAYSPSSQIRGRMWTFASVDADVAVDAELITSRVHAAAARRAPLWASTDSARLVFSEADLLPGCIADRYGDTVVLQLTSAGAERWRDVLADAFVGLDGVRTVYERSDADVRQREGLQPRIGLLRGVPAADELLAHEDGLCYSIDVAAGHKTGFYLDQRDARRAIPAYSCGARVLNVFAYTGAFSVVAAMNGATTITSIDSSGPALAHAARNGSLNGVDLGELVEADAFTALRGLRDRARQYDLILLDPPKLATTERQVDKASRAYKDLNLLAIKLLAPGGVLMTWSCSGAMTAELFQKVLAGAALDARRRVRIIGRLAQPSDHPVPLWFPEAEYLKGFVLQAE